MSLIAGFEGLSELTKELEAGKGRGYLLSWFYANIEEIEQKYDFILIDTHNGFSILTYNAIALADTVVVIADIDEDAIEKLTVEEQHIEELKGSFVNPMTNQSFVNAQLVKIGNKVQSNTND
ncbi:ParA family protein [Listeria monocytogenes]|uniref:ParA family protein n=1 Tax=Listeria monocytogenes TaxID=1639 RepID=UPI0021CDC927|nr:ParA family protein [Listeria monocytogenes]